MQTILMLPRGLSLADADLWQHVPIDLKLGAGLYPCLMTGEFQRLRPNKSLAQGTRLGYVVTTLYDTETKPILEEGEDYLARPYPAREPSKNENSVGNDQFYKENRERLNGEKRIHLTSSASMYHRA